MSVLLRPAGTVSPESVRAYVQKTSADALSLALARLAGADAIVRDLVAEDLVDDARLTNGASGMPQLPSRFVLRSDWSRIRGPRVLGIMAIAVPYDEDRLETMRIAVGQEPLALLNLGILRAFPREYVRPTMGSSAVQPQPRLGWLSEPILVDWMSADASSAALEITLGVNAPTPEHTMQLWFGGVVAERVGANLTFQRALDTAPTNPRFP